ncbi:very-long-chain (3R)-3-hydroxyacyl-CoA dehydratase 2 isoform X2 [Pteronotus mesoamericanus]|uniref:very-long-chain (3R)-3-hydroxyacyl-CoA dehydratase 2 isoform X2 n=1 Tax=Pteronotus mesoamericanus TaxID=1884717 RepID=UPI0023EB3943|nr:very-long-chain (3R)-3-hydroxyacyl-CoA dehydratase 2 isoform X2 [Pteronotus parnellii mesoamericanus]
MAAATATAASKGNGGGGGRAGAGEASGARKKKGPGPLATAYLVIYNVVMTAGWLVIAVGLVRAYLAKGSYHSLYYSIEKPLKFFQTGALLEILHCAIVDKTEAWKIFYLVKVRTANELYSQEVKPMALSPSPCFTQPLRDLADNSEHVTSLLQTLHWFKLHDFDPAYLPIRTCDHFLPPTPCFSNPNLRVGPPLTMLLHCFLPLVGAQVLQSAWNEQPTPCR